MEKHEGVLTLVGTPIALIMAGLMSLAFMGFKGMAQ